MKKKIFLLVMFTFFCVLPVSTSAMQLFVKLNDNVKYVLEVEPSTKIIEVKEKIYNNKDIPKDYQVLMYNDIVLEDDRTLAEYNIQKEYTLDLDVEGLIVDGISLSSKNNSTPDNTAIYNSEENTLTLNNHNGNGIQYYGEDKLNIILKNTNNISANDEFFDYGIYSLLGDIKFSGEGSLNITDFIGGIYSFKNVEVDNTNIAMDNVLAGGIITYGKTIINGNVNIKSFVFPIMTENDVIINGGNIDLKSDTIGIFVTGTGSLYINGGNISILSGEKDTGAAIIVLKTNDNQGLFVDDNMYVVEEGISLQNSSIEYNNDDYVGYTYGSSTGNIVIYEMFVESVNVANKLTIKGKEKPYTYKFINGDNQYLSLRNIKQYVLEIDGDHLLFDSLKIGDLDLIKDEDYTISEGSTIITFTENGITKLNSLKKGEYEVTVKYSNSKEVKGTLNITDISNPQTGDNNIYFIIGIISLILLIISSLYNKNKLKN